MFFWLLTFFTLQSHPKWLKINNSNTTIKCNLNGSMFWLLCLFIDKISKLKFDTLWTVKIRCDLLIIRKRPWFIQVLNTLYLAAYFSWYLFSKIINFCIWFNINYIWIHICFGLRVSKRVRNALSHFNISLIRIELQICQEMKEKYNRCTYEVGLWLLVKRKPSREIWEPSWSFV